MFSIFGIVFVLVVIFVPYVLGGGKMDVIIHGLIFEMPMIGGGAIGALMVGNSGAVSKGAAKDVMLAFKGCKWKKDDYRDLLCMMFMIVKTIKSKGLLALEAHIENPHESTIFSQYSKIQHDHHVVDFICDNLRMITMSFDDPMQVEDVLQEQLKKHHHEILAPAGALQTMSEGLPAIGIVAAVLGVIKTMASIDQPPPVLGGMIGGALVGTFLGVFLSYCLIGPLANKVKNVHEQDSVFFSIIRTIILSMLKGNPPQIAIEIGRTMVPTELQLSFAELEQFLGEVKVP